MLSDVILANEIAIRAAGFLGMLGLMAMWERVSPTRQWLLPRRIRWLNNLSLAAINTLTLRLLFPAAAAGAAVAAEHHDWGLLRVLDPGYPAAVLLTLLALDLVVWIQHVAMHAVPLLWRLHRVHHADPDFDVTTGLRFHPLEMVLSMLLKSGVILLLGPPVAAVILFELLLNATSLFNHGNVSLPPAADRILRLLIVTPDMHRIHHSVEPEETNSNFGFNLSWWDRLFRTYRAEPGAGQQGMTIGLRSSDPPRDITWLPGLLLLPFHGNATDYVRSRHR
jgi:sterol desaturase/sphingolipid hydroxylase (fatty acid hydroxylase superfamily)